MQLQEETRVIVNMLGKFGALTIDQIRKMFEGTKCSSSE